MYETHNLHYEEEQQRLLKRNLKQRKLEQKFLYFGDGATEHYRSFSPVNDLTPDDHYNFIKNHLPQNQEIAIIGLGCGNAEREIGVIKNGLGKFVFHFYGIDSSSSMIKMAEDQSDKSDITNRDLFVADFTAPSFINGIKRRVNGFKTRLYAFLGGTMANVNQTDISDTLFNIMKRGDLLWFDVLVRPGDKVNDLKMMKRAKDQLKDRDGMNFYFRPLAELGIKRDRGEIVLDVEEEEVTGILNFSYSFRFNKPQRIKCDEEILHFPIKDKIKILDIRAYHPESIIKFVESHGFKLIDQSIGEKRRGQFLFQRV